MRPPAAASDVVQRITLAYGLRWASTHAFDGIAAGAERAITVNVAWGPSRTSGAIRVFTHEHVHALKGPTPWLSIDTRVVRVPRGSGQATDLGGVRTTRAGRRNCSMRL
jgi:hypothetical protein